MSIDSEAEEEPPLPGPLYCDASALAKLFLPEPGSDELGRRVTGRDDLLVSELAVTEVASALGRRVREGAIDRTIARKVHAKILSTAAAGEFRVVELLSTTHRDAERLLLAHERDPLRAPDALHLALALGAGAGTLLTYDRALAKAARTQNLAVWPPETG